MINVAVIGYGFAGRSFHSYLVGLDEGLNLHTISTRNPERQALARKEYPNVSVVGDFEEVLSNDAIDLVVLATPHNTHRDLAVQAMNAGKNVVTDKIISMNEQEAIEMAQASEDNGVLFSVFHNRRWDWDYLTMQKVIADGYLGTPYLFESAIMRYGQPGRWRGVKEESGGILYDWGAHLVDQALQLVDSRIDHIYCQIQDNKWDTDIGSYVQLNLNFENGVIYRVEVGNLSMYHRPRFHALGDEGAFVKTGIDPQEPFMKEGRIDDAVEEEQHHAQIWTNVGDKKHFSIPSVRGSWRGYYRNVAETLVGKAELIVTPAQMVRLMRVYDAAMLSAERGQSIPLGI
ncbi:MAG: Gfo/Idh/MocA family oxidoreductase [Candidatus Poribacteria bacterium]|nr:Gfo/Idh/MocA family oxidoreductase [Candidatus Poribacteria bacterium]